MTDLLEGCLVYSGMYVAYILNAHRQPCKQTNPVERKPIGWSFHWRIKEGCL